MDDPLASFIIALTAPKYSEDEAGEIAVKLISLASEMNRLEAEQAKREQANG